MVLRYYADIVGEIKRFSDEGRSLFQFREPLRLNRHLRLECDTGRVRIIDDSCHFEISEASRDAARFPIDFFVTDPRRAAHHSRRGAVERHDRDRRPAALAGARHRGQHLACKFPHALCPRNHANRRADDVTYCPDPLQSRTTHEVPMPADAHLKVALTTNSLVQVDAGFADARQVVFYRVTREGATFEDVVKLHASVRKTVGDKHRR